MGRFAITNSEGLVLNVIVADTLDDAISVAGENSVEEAENHQIIIGDTLKNGIWKSQVPPYEDWTWSGTAWEAPVPKPDDEGDFTYFWNPTLGRWIKGKLPLS